MNDRHNTSIWEQYLGQGYIGLDYCNICKKPFKGSMITYTRKKHEEERLKNLPKAECYHI